MSASTRTVIVCLAEHEWSPLPSREQHLMERLSRHVDVVYVNPMLRAREWPFPDRTIQISPSLWVHEALPLPGARRFSWARWMTTAWLARQMARWQREEGTFVLWICSPTGFPFIELLRPHRVVYDMADLQATARGRQADEDERRQIETLAELERPLLAQSDLTLCASTALAEWSVARDAREFVSAIGKLAKTSSAELVTRRRVHAARSSWDVRLAQVADALAGIGVDIEHELRVVHREQAPVQEQTVWPPLEEAVC